MDNRGNRNIQEGNSTQIMATRLPSTFRKLVAKQLSNKFREAVEQVTVPMLTPGPKDVIIRNRFVGINASDINQTAGKYDPTARPPFDVGFEGVGEVVSAGDKVAHMLGKPVAYIQFGAFAEYTQLPAKFALPLPACKAEFVPLLVSGLTAAISLDKVGEMKSGETVLVTAAAGGTGQFAVQLAKNAGCHVIGTCSSEEKVEFLKSIGCDRAINYTKENLFKTLQTEYKNGIDVIYESVGGDTFDACVKNLALKGRLIVIGFITGYQTATGFQPQTGLVTLPPRLLQKSSSIRGFFLNHYMADWADYLMGLSTLLSQKKITSITDNGEASDKGPFKGIDSIVDGVEYLYSRKNKGKIIVEFPTEPTAKL